MNDLIHWALNCALLYVLMVPVAALFFLAVDKTISPKNILPVSVMWWAAWRWPVTLSQVFVALVVRFSIGRN